MAITSSWSGLQQLVIISSAVLMMSSLAAAAVDLSPAAFDVAYTPLFGGENLVRSPDGRTVHLKLDRFTGSGFVSKSAYHHGFFSASIKLPDDYTAGVVVAFYLSNGGTCTRGSTTSWTSSCWATVAGTRGTCRPTCTATAAHPAAARSATSSPSTPPPPSTPTPSPGPPPPSSSTSTGEIVRCTSTGDYPAKPMSVYATIWDGSAWATDGGRHKVDYAYAPFVAVFTDLVVTGFASDDGCGLECAGNAVELMTSEVGVMTPAKRGAMRRFRSSYLTYTACHDRVRYNATRSGGVVFPECDDSDRHDFHPWGESKRVVPPPQSSARSGVHID